MQQPHQQSAEASDDHHIWSKGVCLWHIQMWDPLIGPSFEGCLHTDPGPYCIGSERATNSMANQCWVYAWLGRLVFDMEHTGHFTLIIQNCQVAQIFGWQCLLGDAEEFY